MPFAAATLNDSEPVWPTVALAFCGCVVIEGAALMVRVAAVLVTVTPLASTINTLYSVPDAGSELLPMVSAAVVAPLIPELLLTLLKVFPPFVDTFH